MGFGANTNAVSCGGDPSISSTEAVPVPTCCGAFASQPLGFPVEDQKELEGQKPAEGGATAVCTPPMEEAWASRLDLYPVAWVCKRVRLTTTAPWWPVLKLHRLPSTGLLTLLHPALRHLPTSRTPVLPPGRPTMSFLSGALLTSHLCPVSILTLGSVSPQG